MKYRCTLNHKTPKFNVNYVTKQRECGRHHCNAPIKEIILKESKK